MRDEVKEIDALAEALAWYVRMFTYDHVSHAGGAGADCWHCKARTALAASRPDLTDCCSCGSGQTRRAKHDARGIFLTFACFQCEDEKLAGYRPEVLTDPNYEASESIEEDQ